jgi:hypothetical protein
MILTYREQEINQRDQDGYVNLTQMAKANGVLIGHWSQLEATKAYLQALEADIGKATTKLLIINKGGIPNQQGTWAHPLLALNFGRWISPEFAIWCDKHIKTLLETGTVSIVKSERTVTEYRKALPPVTEYVTAIAKIPELQCSEALKQLLLDKAGDELQTAKLLMPSENKIVRMGVSQRAEELGFKPNHKTRGCLGKFVKAKGLPSTQEKRLCNGQARDICVYEVSEELDNTIRQFFTPNH